AVHRDLHSFPTRRSSDLGEGQGNGTARAMGNVRRLAEGILRRGRIPQIALKIRDGGGGDGILVDVGHSQFPAGAEIGVHRPLAIDRKSTRLNSSHVKISY